jgi:hypothetical protein
MIISNTVMMMRKTQIKQTALALTLVYLFLSGYMTTGMQGHAPTHEHGSNHAAQHSSLICDWMCTASSFVHTSDQVPNQTTQPFVENLPVHVGRFLNPLSIFSFHIRPPPIPLS